VQRLVRRPVRLAAVHRTQQQAERLARVRPVLARPALASSARSS